MRSVAFVTLLFASLAVSAEKLPLEKAQVETSVAAVERGAQQFMDNCHGCHGVKYIRYRDLARFGMDAKKIDEWRADQAMDASIVSQMGEDAAMMSYGTVPPDLSLITKAREGGADHIYTYLIGYYFDKDGMPSNRVFPETKMPDILGMSGATEPEQKTEIQAKARDIVSFLNWAADPHESERHQLGYYVLGYLLVLTVLLYLVKKRVWAKLD